VDGRQEKVMWNYDFLGVRDGGLLAQNDSRSQEKVTFCENILRFCLQIKLKVVPLRAQIVKSQIVK